MFVIITGICLSFILNKKKKPVPIDILFEPKSSLICVVVCVNNSDGLSLFGIDIDSMNTHLIKTKKVSKSNYPIYY